MVEVYGDYQIYHSPPCGVTRGGLSMTTKEAIGVEYAELEDLEDITVLYAIGPTTPQCTLDKMDWDVLGSDPRLGPGLTVPILYTHHILCRSNR